MKFSFCVSTDGKKDISKLLQNIVSLKIPEYEILVIGGDINTTFMYDGKVIGRHISFDETQTSGAWITRKKNILAKEAKYDNLVIVHDYYEFLPGWYDGWVKFGEDFDVATNRILNVDNTRHCDWSIDPILYETFYNKKDFAYLIPYNTRATKLQYISGGYVVVKKHFMLSNPLDETCGHPNLFRDAEDIEWSNRVREITTFKMNSLSTIRATRPKWNVAEMPMETFTKFAKDMNVTIEYTPELTYTRIAFFDWPHWAIGNINKEIIKRLPNGSLMLDWSVTHNPEYIQTLLNADYMFCTSGPGLHSLVKRYGINPNRIYLMSHDEDDLANLRNSFGTELNSVLISLRGFAVPSPHLVSNILGHNINRVPQVVPYGFNISDWTFKPRKEIKNIGLCGAFSRMSNTGHKDCKRGKLVQQVGDTVNLPVINTNGVVANINEWYQQVDLNMTAGVFEGGPLSPFEAAACGIPTFGTNVGSWTKLAHEGAGKLLPVGDRDYVKSAIKLIEYYKNNPLEYEQLSYKVRAEVIKYDWSYIIDDWKDFFENPATDIL